MTDNRYGLQVPGTAEIPDQLPAYRPQVFQVDMRLGYIDRFFVMYSNFFQEVSSDTYNSTDLPKTRLRWHIKNVGDKTAGELNTIAIDRVAEEFPILIVLKKNVNFLVLTK